MNDLDNNIKKDTMNRIKYTVSVCLLWVISLTVLSQESESSHTVTGTVRDAATKSLLPGISVILPGKASAMTDDEGKYSIKLPSVDVILHAYGPGYVKKEISVRGRSVIDIELYAEGFQTVFDAVVSPVGEVSPVGLPYAWVAVRGKNELSTATTADAVLQGKASGMNVIYRSGAPGNGTNIQLRGLNTMHAGSQPLYVVDGMPYENSAYSSSLVGNYFSNPLASIDIKDIESLTVMKDGTSLFGVKGANGVILIRTLKATEMETKIRFHAHTGINFEGSDIPVLDASGYRLLLSDLLQTQGKTGSQIQALPYMNQEKPVSDAYGRYSGNKDYYRYNHNTDWQKELYDASFNQNYYLNVFGGDDVALYALSVGYLDQNGSIKGTGFQRFNTRFNSEVNLGKRFKLNANMSFVYTTRKLIQEGPDTHINPIYAALVKSPFMASRLYDADGRISPAPEDFDVLGKSNPSELINNSSRKNIQYRFIGHFDAEYKLNEKLSAHAILGVNFNKERERIFYPNTGIYFDTLALGAVRNALQHRIDRIFSLFTEAHVNYHTGFGIAHQLNVKGGVRYQNNQAQDDWGKAYNSGSDNFKSINYGEALLNQVGGAIGNWNWMSAFATVDYGFKDRYFFNASMSADASSRYGKEAPDMLVYPSVAGAWLISGEEFLKSADKLDLLKLRLSYGIAGNDDIGNYSGMQYYVPKNILGTYGIIRGNLVDLNLKPEKSARLNLGVDASVLNERFNLSLDLYQVKISDMIVQKPASRLSGFEYQLSNAGAMKNTGIDLSLNARVLNGLFKWDLGTTISAYKNEVTDLKGEEYMTTVCGGNILTRVGSPLGVFYGYQTNGVYSTAQEAASAGLNVSQNGKKLAFGAGDVRFVNRNNDDLIDEGDQTVIGDPNPDVFGSFTNTFSYDRWKLDVFMTYSLGNDVYNYTRAMLEGMSGYENQTQAVLRRWKVEGDRTDMPRAVYGDPMGNARFSDRWIEDGSFLKLKAVSLSYALPVNARIVQKCTLFLTGENLLTWTKYKGLDPEFSLGTNTLYSGVDAGFTPHPRTVSIGVKLNL